MARGGAKPRELDYSSVGTQGRRTGITLKQGKRDEHGMEEVTGLFSSPEKSPAKVNGFDLDSGEDSIGSEGMSLDEGNAPGPLDYLNPNSVSRSSFLPPHGRSPVKGRSESTRQSPDLHSTPDPEGDLLSSPSDDKGLSATRGSRQELSPLTARSANVGASKQKSNSQRSAKRPAAESESAVLPDFSDREDDENAHSFLPGDEDGDDTFGLGNETIIPEDDSPDAAAQDEPSDAEENSIQKPGPSKSSGKQTKSGSSGKAPAAQPAKAKSGKRGRPAKTSNPRDDEAGDARPQKKQKTAKPQAQVNREQLDPELDKVVETYAQRTGPLKGRSLYILKRENPTDTSSTHTRSGRASIRPLAYWRNERCVYGDGESAEGHRYPLSTIKEIVRTEELEPEHKKKGKRAGRKSKSKKHADESSDEDDQDADVWEKEGVLHGYIPKWDPKSQTSSKEEDILDIAYAPAGIETREVKDSTFRFAKLLSSSFIGSGVVELPPEGVKRPKNSKKMHMVFYVCHGRVQVDISGVQFSAGKGCVFQVPRGNYYSFQNAHRKEARLFFTQGCVPGEGEESSSSKLKPAVQDSEFEGEGEGEGEVETEAKKTKPSRSAPSASSAPSAPPATKSRGRPKGKQKAK